MSGVKATRTEGLPGEELAAARATIYAFLSQFFLAPPSEAALASLRDRAFVSELAAGLGMPSSPNLEAPSEGAAHDHASLVQEYHDLFLVPMQRYVAAYESVYRGSRVVDGRWRAGLLQGRHAVEVQADYREAGAMIAEKFADLPDHAGLESTFMRFLCESESEAWDRNDRDEATRHAGAEDRFLEEHSAQWIPALCHQIREKAEGPLFKGIACLAEAFIALERPAHHASDSRSSDSGCASFPSPLEGTSLALWHSR